MPGGVEQAGYIGLFVVPDRAIRGKGKAAPFLMLLIGINPYPPPRLQDERRLKSEFRLSLAYILYHPSLQIYGRAGVIQHLHELVGFGAGH